MEPKKNQHVELKRNSLLYFFMGMFLVLLLIYTALEWKTYDPVVDWDYAKLHVQDELIEEVPITKIELPKPKIIQAPPIIEIVPDDDENIIETVIESTEPDQDTEISPIETIEVADDDEPEIVPWVLIEDAPTFPGCENVTDKEEKKLCFQEMMQKHIRKHFRYPEIAQEMGLEGRVNVVFTIQKDGKIADVRMRGPHESLETEAARIISKLPQMIPGKQRGTAVKVPFSIPITFKLN
ncbi:MAG: TonB family protein [Flavobacteriaceae bacterium]|uniref:energy transducer TonB n=1 Tax=Flagellimonas sp. SN16 TaxID=3415142 RepID=UPI003C5F1CB9|nr:TonB family protein [Flavobacteriaceae bacterium]